MPDQIYEKILKELELIRKLKMIELAEAGYSQRKMAAALGLSKSSVGRMMAPKSKDNKGDPDA